PSAATAASSSGSPCGPSTPPGVASSSTPPGTRGGGSGSSTSSGPTSSRTGAPTPSTPTWPSVGRSTPATTATAPPCSPPPACAPPGCWPTTPPSARARGRSVRLLTNNPAKVEGLRSHGVVVAGLEPLPTAPHVRNLRYLRTKEQRLGHVRPTGATLDGDRDPGPVDPRSVVDVSDLVGPRF